MSVVRFVDQPGGWTRINFPYDPELVAIVKDVSRGSRTYDPATKTWSVQTEMAETVAEAMIAAGHQIGGETMEASPAPRLEDFFSGTVVEEYDAKAKAAEIIASLPGQHVGKVFRAMARQLYPDLYGLKS